MKRRRRRAAASLPAVAAELMLASAETIFLRGLMLANGTLSTAEAQRMVSEKLQAASASSLAAALPPGPAMLLAMLAPWHKQATANARRLRRKRG